MTEIIISWIIFPVYKLVDEYVSNKYYRLLLSIPMFILTVVWFVPGLIIVVLLMWLEVLLSWCGFNINIFSNYKKGE